MKKLLLVLILIVSSIIGYCQSEGTLYMTAYSDAFCQKSRSVSTWDAWQKTSATFYIYKSGTLTTKIVVVGSNGTSFTFYGYADERVPYDNGDYRYKVFCYESGDNSSKTYDRTEYFRMTDYKKEDYSVFTLLGRDDNDYAWQIKNFSKIQ